MKYLRLIIHTFILFFLFVFSSNSEIISNIKISGNKFILSDTLLSKIKFVPGKDYNQEDLNNIQKKIFETGYFQKIDFRIVNDTLVINVKENPVIDFFYIYGDKNKDRIEKIYELVELRSGNLFSDHKLLSDIERINDLYKYSGYYNVIVEPVVKQINESKVNISIKITKNEQFKINRIYFFGNKVFKPGTLLDVVSSSENSWFKFLSSSKLLNADRVKYDAQLLRNFYLNEGYFDVQILSSKIDIKEDNTADILYSIESGKKYSFGNINFKNISYLEINEQKKLLLIAKKISKNFYSKKKVLFLKDEIFNIVSSNKGQFLDFTVKEEKKLDKINITIIFSERKLPIVNNILVKGNSITEEKVVRNNLIFSEGDTFSNYKLTKSQDNLKDIGIFKDAKVQLTKLSNDLVNIDIDVIEQPTGSIMGGVGVSSSETAITFSVTEKNLFGKNIVVNTDLSLGTQKIIGNFSIINPDYNDTGRLIKNDFFAQETNYDSVGYDSKLIGDSISTGYDIYDNIRLNIGFGADYDKISASSSASSIYKNQAGNYKTFKAFYGISNDKRNRKFQTTNGHIVGFNQTLSLPGSDIAYISNSLYGKYYYSVDKDYILNLRSGVSNISGYNNDNVKLSNRLFLSNKQLRGFESRKTGPVDGADHVGGNNSAYAGISSTFPNPFPEKWNATTLFFLDAGNVWGVDYDSSKDSNKIRSAAGLALDWLSPLGPISFTLSNSISKTSTDDDQNFSFQIGSTF